MKCLRIYKCGINDRDLKIVWNFIEIRQLLLIDKWAKQEEVLWKECNKDAMLPVTFVVYIEETVK